jgi:mRNA-degrading endonuclease YafQ of YafQ-DinJ toxin-antitoxin module
MYSIDYTKRFNKDLKRCMKRGLDLQLIHEAISLLRATGTLPMKYRPHKLVLTYKTFPHSKNIRRDIERSLGLIFAPFHRG